MQLGIASLDIKMLLGIFEWLLLVFMEDLGVEFSKSYPVWGFDISATKNRFLRKSPK